MWPIEAAHRATICKDTDFVWYEQTAMEELLEESLSSFFGSSNADELSLRNHRKSRSFSKISRRFYRNSRRFCQNSRRIYYNPPRDWARVVWFYLSVLDWVAVANRVRWVAVGRIFTRCAIWAFYFVGLRSYFTNNVWKLLFEMSFNFVGLFCFLVFCWSEKAMIISW